MVRTKGRGGQAKSLTKKEIKKIDRAMGEGKWAARNRAIFYVGLGSGMRVGEIAGLIMGQTYGKRRSLGEIVLDKHSTKSKKSRTVMLSPQAREVLDAWRLARREQDWSEEPDAPVFPHGKDPSRCMTPNAAAHVFSDMSETAGVAGFSSHSMRRTHANTLRENGFDLYIIKEQLGHASLNTTARYFSVTANQRRKAVKGMRF